jgi:tRNA-specific 2-thiouridylase
MTNSAKKVLVGFSGGADSTAAVLMLRAQGWDVTGLYFSVTGDEKLTENSVQAVARHLELPIVMKNVSHRFKEIVIKDFCLAYAEGKTPNPCVLCNPAIKFRILCEEADRQNISHIATGHYARIFRDSNGINYVRKGANTAKDQSYMLYRLPQSVLSRVLFPLGEVESKEDVRIYLESFGLPNARSKDSQDICFIQDRTYQEFLKDRSVEAIPGPFTDREGNILGMHQGILNYTPGQRKGLGIALGKPAYVIGINSENNTVILGEEAELYRHSVEVRDPIFTAFGASERLPEPYRSIHVDVKLRYTAKPAAAVLYQDPGERITIQFDQPQRAPAPGQSAVFYQEELILGGGFIL